MEENKLEYFVYCLPYFQKAFGNICSVGLSDREKFIATLDGTELKMPIKAGDPVKEGTASSIVIKEGKEIIKQVDKKVFGVPYMSRSIPIKDDNGSVIGVLSVAIPTTIQEELNDLVKNANNHLYLLESSTATVAATSQEFAATVSTLAQSSDGVMSKMRVVNSILGLIKEVSDQTHLLGLNAAIESARAGDLGRGFNVVAGEIRKLASRTRESVTQINDEIKKVLEAIEEIANNVQQVAAASQEQAVTAEEIGRSTSELKDQSERIFELSNKLMQR